MDRRRSESGLLRAKLVRLAAWLLVAACCGPPPASADTPSTAYIFPAGGRRGATVEFRVGAHFLHGGSPFEMLGEGAKASRRIVETKTVWFEGPMIFKPASQGSESYPKDHLGQVQIASDAAVGVRRWRLWTSQGAAPSRKFVVGDLPEVVEQEIEGRPLPTPVDLPVTINGRIFPREDVDIWTFRATAGQTVTCDVVAARLGSPLDSRLQVIGPDGRTVAENVDHFGVDSFVRFTAPSDGRYQVRIHDINYRGLQDYVYRLTLTSGPFVDRVFPLGGRRGENVAFEVAGQATPGDPVRALLPPETGPTLQSFLIHDTLSNPILIDVGEHPEVIEKPADDNDRQESSLPVRRPPVTLNGRIERAGDRDLWAIEAVKGRPLEIELLAARFASPLDGVLRILDSTGKELAKAGCTPLKRIEPSLKFTPPDDGVYCLEVSDFRERAGDAAYAYRMKVAERGRPDFELTLPTDALTLYRGQQIKLKVTAVRRGYTGEIALRAVDLPKGVEAAEVKIPAFKKNVDLVLKAAEDARVQGVHIKIVGRGKVASDDPKVNATTSGPLVRTARHPGAPGEPAIERVLLAVSMPTPFTIDGVAFRTSYAARGTVFRRKYAIHRNGYDGPLRVALADRQIRHLQGVTGPSFELPEGATEFLYPINVPTWLEMNRTGRIVVMAVGQVADEQGRKHTVSFSSGVPKDQVIILTAPSPMSIRAARASLAARAGESVELPIEVSRGVLDPAEVKVELRSPDHLRGVTAEPLTIPAGQSRARLRLRFTRPLGPFNAPLTIRATTVSKGDPVIAETKLTLSEAQ